MQYFPISSLFLIQIKQVKVNMKYSLLFPLYTVLQFFVFYNFWLILSIISSIYEEQQNIQSSLIS